MKENATRHAVRVRSTTAAVVTITLLALLASDADAQRRSGNASRDGGRGQFMIGIERLDLDELNAALDDNGYPTFSDNFLTLGGAGFAIRNGFIIGGEGHGVIQSSETSGSLRTGVAGGYGMFNVGYMVVRERHFSIFPILGIGGGGLSLSIEERAPADFDDVLDSPGRAARLTNAGLLLGAALGADLLISLDDTGRKGFTVGFRAGWSYMPIESDWQLNGIDVGGGPETVLGGPYVRLSIGGGSR